MATTPVQRYLDQVIATFATAAGRPIRLGTSVVAFDDRTSSHAVAYLLPGRTLVAGSEAAAERLRVLDGGPSMSQGELEGRAGDLGGRVVDVGVNLVLPDDRSDAPRAASPPLRTGWTARWLDVEDSADTELLARFLEASSDEDLDEVEIDPARPDPAICVLVDSHGDVGAYASARPFWAAPAVDDIGVLVAPEHRRGGLGAAVVRAFVERRRHDLPQLYRHAVGNEASAGVARSVGFVEAHRVVAVDVDAD